MKNKNEIIEKVFDFYAKNKAKCDYCYELAEDKKIDELYETIDDHNDINSLLTQVAIVVLTANKYEKNVLHKDINCMGVTKIKRFRIELKTSCNKFNNTYAYFFCFHGYSILHIHANVTGSYTIGGAADVVRWIKDNSYLYPSAVLSFGICFGTQEKHSEIGHVIISKKIYPYLVGLKINGEKIEVVDDNSFIIDEDLRLKIQSLVDNNKFNSLPFKVKFKNYITGEAVISSSKWRMKISKTTTQEIFAGEMEAYGVFKECTSNNFNIPCLVIKSICDWGTEKNFNTNNKQILSLYKDKLNIDSDKDAKESLAKLKDVTQAFAADCAVNALTVLLNNNTFDVSLFEKFKREINNYNGVVTTCKSAKNTINELIYKSNIGYRVSSSYVHRCLMILHDLNIIKCHQQCLLSTLNNDCCTNNSNDASIDIIKGGSNL